MRAVAEGDYDELNRLEGLVSQASESEGRSSVQELELRITEAPLDDKQQRDLAWRWSLDRLDVKHCPRGAAFQAGISEVQRAVKVVQKYYYHMRVTTVQVRAIVRTYLWRRYVLEGTDAPLLGLREHLRDRIGRLRSRRVPAVQGERTFLPEELQPQWRDQPYFLDYTEDYVDGLDYGAVSSIRVGRGREVYGSVALGLQYCASRSALPILILMRRWAG